MSSFGDNAENEIQKIGNLIFEKDHFMIFILYKFTLFKDKDQRLHQQLWCGDVVDSSDEEEKNANAKFG